MSPAANSPASPVSHIRASICPLLSDSVSAKYAVPSFLVRVCLPATQKNPVIDWFSYWDRSATRSSFIPFLLSYCWAEFEFAAVPGVVPEFDPGAAVDAGFDSFFFSLLNRRLGPSLRGFFFCFEVSPFRPSGWSCRARPADSCWVSGGGANGSIFGPFFSFGFLLFANRSFFFFCSGCSSGM